MWCVLTLYNLCNHNFFFFSGNNIKYFCIKNFQKLEERSALVEKKFTDPKEKEKWSKILTAELISSEESGSDNGEQVLIVRALPWRSSRVDHMFRILDKSALSMRSPQGRRQMKRRVAGSTSTRPQCQIEGIPKWAVSTIM